MIINSLFNLHDTVMLSNKDNRGDLGKGTVVGISCTLKGIFISVAWGGIGTARYRRTLEYQSHLRLIS